MTIQIEKVTASDNSAAHDQPELVKIPTVVEFTIPPESLEGFEADYERVSATWAADLGTTTDHAKFEQFVTSAHSLARRWLPDELVARLENFLPDLTAPPALVVRGLIIEKDLPPTGKDAHLKMAAAGKFLSETWLVGIGRIAGQVFTFANVRARQSRGGMGMLMSEIYPTREAADFVSLFGSQESFDLHVDYARVHPAKFPNVIAFMGVRGDRNGEGKTLVCNNRKLYRLLDPADIKVLRNELLAWDLNKRKFSQHVIEGPESSPRINLNEENIVASGGVDKNVKGSPQAIAAYKRVKEIAATLAEGVWLGGGDVLLLNQKKATHGRSPYSPKFDGNDRWVHRTYINSGGFWDAGLTEWPSRTLSCEEILPSFYNLSSTVTSS